ncbi:cytochrome P450 [Ceraceosorus guamensis]|uniref:Cytochrome P450 n=1 Tax=Ceraceosorus guamensis TaxID=1522189 RepID=A0A316VSJ0_9BASI|nr:cytochrome P450 [Ceraceosorus guamensis]PWN40330.1 cytochrome P450 [Ceraceosorus guamensis]
MKLEDASSGSLGPVIEVIQSILNQTGYILPALVLFIIALAIKYPNRLPGTTDPKHRPGVYFPPGADPLIGHTRMIVGFGSEGQFENFKALSDATPAGSWNVSFLGTSSMTFVNRPEYLEYIQKTNFDNFPKGSQFTGRLGDLLGVTGIFVADGHPWKTQRKQASHMFSNREFNTWVRAVIHNELDDISALLDNVTAKNGPGKLILPELMFRYTLSSFAKMAFAANLNCLSPDPDSLKRPVPFAVAFDRAQAIINDRFITPGWYIWEKFNKTGRDMRSSIKTIREFGLDIIHKRLAERQDEKKDPLAPVEGTKKEQLKKEGKDLLDFFMDLTTDPEELLIVVLNFIIAGRDTTAQSLSWLFYELMAHPEHVPKIRKEIAEKFGEPEGGVRLDYESFRELPYTVACLHEAIRLHPAVPKNGKAVMKDDVIIPQGPNPDNLPPVRVFAGERVGWSDWVMARTPAIWGADCEEYNPSRFLETDEAGKLHLRNFGQWKSHYFNAGPRLCLGMNLATYEATAFIAAVLPRFNFEWATAAQGQKSAWPPQYANSVTHPIKDPYLVNVTRVKA